MFSPVGSQPPSVYWRRRIIVLGAVVLLIVLIVLTLRAAFGGSGTSVAGSTNSASRSGPSPTPSTSRSTSLSTSSSPVSSSAKPSSSPSTSQSAPPSSVAVAQCRTADLAVRAVVGKPSYSVGDQPMLELQVTNTGPKPCVQDLADGQVALKVYNGESRVWGSHDCEIKAGTDDRTLAVNAPVRVTITWSGFTSRPNCAGTRQRVGAGTYTLYATLSGTTGKAAQFSIG